MATKDQLETETLAGLYEEQGAHRQAFLVFERILARDPGHPAARVGRDRNFQALSARERESVMGETRRLAILERMLARLTGAELKPLPAVKPVRHPDPAPAAVAQAVAMPAPMPTIASAPVAAKPPRDPRVLGLPARRLSILQAMLERLTGLSERV